MILADGALSQLNFETLLVPGPSPGPGQEFRPRSRDALPARRRNPALGPIAGHARRGKACPEAQIEACSCSATRSRPARTIPAFPSSGSR
jgi:hypothetical protein